MDCKVSVIVPVYNAEAFLFKCVDSIIVQQLRDIEIILVNDGSTDRSGEICDGYAQQDDRIRVIHSENQGASGARNTGIEVAAGEFIAFVDADDWIDSQMYADLYEDICRTRADMIMCDFYIYDGQAPYRSESPWPEDRMFELGEIFAEVIPAFISRIDIRGNKQQLLMGSVWKGLFRREIIIKYDLRFDPEIRYVEDLVFVLNYLSKSERFVFIDIPYYYYRMDAKNKTGMTQKYMADLYPSWNRCKEQIYRILQDVGYASRMRRQMEWRNIHMVLWMLNNLCAVNSPYGFAERRSKARFYIEDSGFKKSVDKVGLKFFTPMQRVLITLARHSLVSLVIAYYTWRNR